jgi:predicted nucleic-acid-binding protein
VLAVDTSVVVRYVARDDAGQAAKADALFRSEQILLLKTVFLETEWVLRYAYEFDRATIAAAFRALAGLPSVRVEEEAAVFQALDWFAAGMDLADALHLASCPATVQFATFDRKVAARARRLKASPVVSLT